MSPSISRFRALVACGIVAVSLAAVLALVSAGPAHAGMCYSVDCGSGGSGGSAGDPYPDP
jgi:hypothetical protein